MAMSFLPLGSWKINLSHVKQGGKPEYLLDKMEEKQYSPR
jgi:hypothetical protein